MTAAPSRALSGSVEVPGDKSLSHRAIILAAMAQGRSRITGLSDGDDVRRTIEAVRALGARAEQQDGAWILHGGAWRSPEAPIDCGNSGTSARLLMGAVAGRPVAATFTGDESLRRRPMRRVTGPLSSMAARVEEREHLPIRIEGGGLKGISFANETASAQVKSAILLAGLGAAGPIEIVEPAASRDHSERMLAWLGVDISSTRRGGAAVIRLGEERRVRPAHYRIAGDPSSAAFLLVAALITAGSEVTVCNLLANPLRTGLIETLREMGADLQLANQRIVGGEPVADVTARSSRLRGVTVPPERAPSMIDEYPILAVAAACAEGETVTRGLAELRHKESDRLAAILAGLAACGIKARVEGDDLIVTGGQAGGATVAGQGDHRIAMSFLTLGLTASAPITVDGADMIATSFPAFAKTMRALGADLA